MLKRLGYIDAEGMVELKGKVACEIHQAELLITELMVENALSNLTIPQVPSSFPLPSSCASRSSNRPDRSPPRFHDVPVQGGLGHGAPARPRRPPRPDPRRRPPHLQGSPSLPAPARSDLLPGPQVQLEEGVEDNDVVEELLFGLTEVSHPLSPVPCNP